MAPKKLKLRKGLGALGSTLLSKLSAEKREEVFTVAEAEEVLGLRGGRLWRLLHELSGSRWIERIERGMYLMIPLESGPDENYGTHQNIIARKLASPYY
ncbi:MAG: hypothetical protein NT157_06260, partial [Candidatus Micrarchaeota archaeon]|nr:hypothetical protein [Candidatus Micrarchaeota archaeon]